jgi:hypothetical protein
MGNNASQAYNRSCPEPVSCVHVTQNTMQMGKQRGEIITEKLCSTTLLNYTMSHDACDWYEPQVFVNGLLQLTPDHYSIEGRVVTFTGNLAEDDDVQVRYAALIESELDDDADDGCPGGRPHRPRPPGHVPFRRPPHQGYHGPHGGQP